MFKNDIPVQVQLIISNIKAPNTHKKILWYIGSPIFRILSNNALEIVGVIIINDKY